MTPRAPRPLPVLAALAALAVALTGCARNLVLNPHLLVREGPPAFELTPEPFRTPEMRVLYVTDRDVRRERPDGPDYGYQRSQALRFGVATVRLDPEPASWSELVEATTAERRRSYGLDVARVEPIGDIDPVAPRLEPTPDGRLRYRDASLEHFRREAAGLHHALAPWLDAGATDVLIYVHGFNNTFDDAVRRTAELWHFTGRRMVPIAYTWPAGAGLSIQGYSRDRESSEFTVMHLKLLVMILSRSERVERIHVVSHSRGTDVAASMVRELHLEQGRGQNGMAPVREAFKLHTLVMAAPDLDREVFNQRFVSENAISAPERFVMYFSRRDSALGLASWLLRSAGRMGRLRLEDFERYDGERLEEATAIEVIECDVREGGSSHSYLFENPAALSDLVLVLRDDVYAGEAARPLESPRPGFWRLTDEYLDPAAATAAGPE